ncbi:hypothetical protein DFH11DRAFT_1570697 [Phellopilus nigrolimitatus]|nr:hypothetical protein DFH11DRAFT_1570697 [Phellopilus nigrolimitatus]
MSAAEVARELAATHVEHLPEPLDPALFQPTRAEWDFLHAAVAEDEGEIRRRVLEVQKEAYSSYPYPCLRNFDYIQLMMSMNRIYPAVLAAARTSPDSLFLDLGCCMGTDVRKLVLDGYPATRVAGCDLRRTFIDAGHALFADRDTCRIAFFTSDIFTLDLADPDPRASAPRLDAVRSLDELRGRLDHVYAGALFHLFGEGTQRAIAVRLARLLRTQGIEAGAARAVPASGCVVFGRHEGRQTAGPMEDKRDRYGHSIESWRAMWRAVFAELHGEEFAATRVKVDAELIPTHKLWLFWSVRIT